MLGNNQSSTDHRGNAGGVADSLRADLFVAFLMVADIINIDGLFLAIFSTGKDTTDVGLAHGARTEGSRIRQQRFEELNRYNFLAFIVNRLGRQHANVLQALHVCQIALAEGHEEADAFYAGDILS